MNATDIRIEKLPSMRVARFHAVGRNPERVAWMKLWSWAEPRGLLRDASVYPVFGFNNPAPSPDRAEYGYEFWIRIDPDIQVEGGIEILDTTAGWYAVTTLQGLPTPEAWTQFLEQVRKSPHRFRMTHELEKPHAPLAPESKAVFDLYLPIETPDEQAKPPASTSHDRPASPRNAQAGSGYAVGA